LFSTGYEVGEVVSGYEVGEVVSEEELRRYVILSEFQHRRFERIIVQRIQDVGTGVEVGGGNSKYYFA